MSRFDFDTSSIPARYDVARALTPAAIALWLDAIGSRVSRPSFDVILDLGCGTGRFTGALHRRFSARVIGIDRSREMLKNASATLGRCARFVQGAAECLPLCDDAVDMIFISQVWHHIQDKRAAAHEIARVLKPGGYLCIRTATLESLDNSVYLRFFPAALKIDGRIHPARADMVDAVELSRLKLTSHALIRQPVADNFSAYAERIALRGYSDLASISDEAFSHGLQRLRQFCDQQPKSEFVFDALDLFIFRKTPNPRESANL
jgi:ubiquinone/menaquinone biosynthesis C-methylase UbiE